MHPCKTTQGYKWGRDQVALQYDDPTIARPSMDTQPQVLNEKAVSYLEGFDNAYLNRLTRARMERLPIHRLVVHGVPTICCGMYTHTKGHIRAIPGYMHEEYNNR